MTRYYEPNAHLSEKASEVKQRKIMFRFKDEKACKEFMEKTGIYFTIKKNTKATYQRQVSTLDFE